MVLCHNFFVQRFVDIPNQFKSFFWSLWLELGPKYQIHYFFFLTASLTVLRGSLMHVSQVGVELGVLGFGCTMRESQTLSGTIAPPLSHPAKLCGIKLRWKFNDCMFSFPFVLVLKQRNLKIYKREVWLIDFEIGALLALENRTPWRGVQREGMDDDPL